VAYWCRRGTLRYFERQAEVRDVVKGIEAGIFEVEEVGRGRIEGRMGEV
jgi:hypothetical protein